MDFSKFLDDNFDTKEWVNQVFASSKESSTNKDQIATNLVVKLQMFIQEVNNIIEDASQQAIQNLPRVVREAEAIRQESVLLQEQMRMVKEDIERVERDTSTSMETLLKIDGIKIKMKAASDALQEADNWTTLSSDMEEVFRSQDIDAITAKLVGMQQSLHMLFDVSDYEQRVQHLEQLKNRLETLLSTQLVAAFNAQSLDAALVYVRIFTDIERLPQLHNYYHKCQKNSLLQSWRTIIESNPDDTLFEWLTEYYDHLISTWHAQVKWCGQAFTVPVPLVCNLIRDSLNSLEPSIQALIIQTLQGTKQPLVTVIELKNISDRFAKSMESVLDTYTSGNHDLSCIGDLAQTIYQPYRRYITKYGAFEDKLLNEELDTIPLDHEDVIDSVRLLAASVAKLFAIANQANNRCIEFTCGTGYPDLLQALDSYFNNYLKEFYRVLVNLREKCKAANGDPADDWSFFQHSMRIIQTCGELILHTEEFDHNVTSSILDSIGRHSMSSPQHKGTKKYNPFQDYKNLYLENEEDKNGVEALLIKLEEGEAPSVLQAIMLRMCSASEHAHKFGFDLVFAQLQDQLRSLPKMEIWKSHSAGSAITADLPQFSLSPQEYITKIGQYLMTLPQQLEPFTLEDNTAVLAAVKYGKLPYTNQQEVPENIADLWLESLACGTMHIYCESILKIIELTSHASKQLITDIEYLCNVVDDLGLHPSNAIKDILALLKAPSDTFYEAAQDKPQRVVSAVASMRSIHPQ